MRALSISTMGELNSPLAVGSRGELILATVIRFLNPTGGGADPSDSGILEREDLIIIKIIKEFMKQIY